MYLLFSACSVYCTIVLYIKGWAIMIFLGITIIDGKLLSYLLKTPTYLHFLGEDNTFYYSQYDQ